MQKKQFTELRVGIFVFIALLLGMITLFQVGSKREMFASQYTLYANFQDISGLRIGASVQLAGLDVGYVDDIRFPKDILIREITVVLRINRKYQERIRADSVASINTQGLLGDKYVYISVGSEEEPVLKEKGVIKTKETVSIFALAEKAGEIMDDIGKASKAINDMLKSVSGEKEGDLKASMRSLRNTLEQIEKGKGVLHALIYDPKGEKIISDLGETMTSIKEITTGVSEDTKEKAAGLVSNLRKASADLKEIMGSIKRGEGTLGMLIRDPSLYNDLRALLGRANRNALMRSVVRATIREDDAKMLK